MFHRLAKIYDLLYAGKDYEGEVARLRVLVQRFGRSGGRRWLDVACGTGRHLEVLRRDHDVVGVDGSADMLRIARRRLPGVRLVHADMRTFRLEPRFDVVSCLFSAIGHLPSERELLRAYRNFATHLAPGGVLLVEPWIDPAEFRPGHLHLVTQQESGLAVVRLAVSGRRGRRSVVDYDYLVGTPGQGVKHFHERDVGLLVAPTRQLALLRQAGLRPRFHKNGLTTGRGLLVATRPR